MKATLPFVLLIGIALARQSVACSPVPATKDSARTADAVLVGEATSSRPGANSYELLIGVDVSEVLKGKKPNEVLAFSPCAVPIHKGKRVVVLVINGQQVVYPSELYESIFRAGIRAER